MIKKIVLLFIVLLNILTAELYYSGKFNIPYNFYLKNYKNTEIPIRFLNLNIHILINIISTNQLGIYYSGIKNVDDLYSIIRNFIILKLN